MKRIIITLLMMMMLTTTVFAYSAGQRFTQTQLDRVESVSRSDLYVGGVVPSITSVTSKDGFYVIHYPLLVVRKDDDTGNYYFKQVNKQIPLDKQDVKKCVQELGKEDCITNKIMPFIKRQAVFQIDREVDYILKQKTRSSDLTEEDLFGRGLN